MEHDAPQTDTRPKAFSASLRITLAITVIAAVLLGAVVFLTPPQQSKADAGLIHWQSNFASVLRDDIMGNMQPKPVLMVFTADYCPPCQYMKKNVYTNPDLAALIRDNFLAVKVDLTQPGPEEYGLSSRHNVKYLPTIIILDQAETEVVRANTLSADRMLRMLRAALEHVKRNPPHLPQSRFSEDNTY